jgi:hypothetical protein
VPVVTGWVCWSQSQPELKWFSDHDSSNDFLGIACRRVELQEGDVTVTQWWRFWRLLKQLSPILDL